MTHDVFLKCRSDDLVDDFGFFHYSFKHVMVNTCFGSQEEPVTGFSQLPHRLSPIDGLVNVFGDPGGLYKDPCVSNTQIDPLTAREDVADEQPAGWIVLSFQPCRFALVGACAAGHCDRVILSQCVPQRLDDFAVVGEDNHF